MKLLGNTVLQYDETSVSYEIFYIGQMLVFKPYFYSIQPEFPCILLNYVSSGWQIQDDVDEGIKKQIWEDVASLKFLTVSTLFSMNDGLFTPAVGTANLSLYNTSSYKRT